MLRRLLMALVLCCTAAGAPALADQTPAAYIPPGAPLPEVQGQSFLAEVESNNTFGTATFLPSTSLSARGDIFPAGDVDYYSFVGSAGARVYVAVITSFATSSANDSVLQVLDIDGLTVLEADENDGSFAEDSSSVAGVLLPAAGIYYLRVSSTSTVRPYHLHFALRTGSPTAETGPNDTSTQANALAASAWITGSLSDTGDRDFYQVDMQAGGTLFASLDLNPDRGAVEWNGRLGVAYFDGNILFMNDSGTGDAADSEAIVMTVNAPGTYYVYVDSNDLSMGSYQLSIVNGGNYAEGDGCTTYTSTDTPKTITGGPSVVTSTLTIPDQFFIADLNVTLNLTHTNMPDLDVVLVAPGGNASGLFTDVGSSSFKTMDLVLDDEAGLPIGVFDVLQGLALQPEPDYRLHWFDGQQANGEWTLKNYVDDAGGDSGELLSWSLTGCARPTSTVVCPAGTSLRTVAHSDFEDGPAGFTHSGTLDEWELGLPSQLAVNGCFSGSQCWATDLDGTYEASSSQTLASPVYSLAGYQDGAWVFWAQRHQLESADFDHASVDVSDASLNTRRLWEWRDATMVTMVGFPGTDVEESTGWAVRYANITGFIGAEIGLTFKLESDISVQLGGLAIDDIWVVACKAYPLYLPLTIK